ncbi:hypothetical protein CI109_103255 [Kwoniella shandongensis]|uniref:Uncharacterized protein n=1 Tax=Kwoniella shandongensis TaxID=1734106 RepID=A0A5M6BUD6_9TREE|nr:uncharacterized protein CI109_006073 [Kwoniella shandongensis]KAA5525622.1 hypothetical protein CI109_006073 [Kwoniella shandongensis]
MPLSTLHIVIICIVIGFVILLALLLLFVVYSARKAHTESIQASTAGLGLWKERLSKTERSYGGGGGGGLHQGREPIIQQSDTTRSNSHRAHGRLNVGKVPSRRGASSVSMNVGARRTKTKKVSRNTSSSRTLPSLSSSSGSSRSGKGQLWPSRRAALTRANLERQVRQQERAPARLGREGSGRDHERNRARRVDRTRDRARNKEKYGTERRPR